MRTIENGDVELTNSTSFFSLRKFFHVLIDQFKWKPEKSYHYLSPNSKLGKQLVYRFSVKYLRFTTSLKHTTIKFRLTNGEDMN